METLRRAGANVLGIVLNGIPAKSELAYGGYYGTTDAAIDAGGQAPRAQSALWAAPPTEQARSGLLGHRPDPQTPS
jgi:Mrp family chromosome partitioning ATPase